VPEPRWRSGFDHLTRLRRRENVYLISASSLTHYLSLVVSSSFIFYPRFVAVRSPPFSILSSSTPPPIFLPPSSSFLSLYNLLLHLLTSPPSLLLSSSLSSGLTKDGGGSANAESLEEVLNILAEEGSDWIYGFFTFLYDVVSSPVERPEEDEEEEEAAEMQEEGGTTPSDDGEVKGVILDLQDQ